MLETRLDHVDWADVFYDLLVFRVWYGELPLECTLTARFPRAGRTVCTLLDFAVRSLQKDPGLHFVWEYVGQGASLEFDTDLSARSLAEILAKIASHFIGHRESPTGIRKVRGRDLYEPIVESTLRILSEFQGEESLDNPPTDIRVRPFGNPKTLDLTVRGFSMVEAYVVSPETAPDEDGCCVVRVFRGDPGFVRFAINRQGYGKVVDEPEESRK